MPTRIRHRLLARLAAAMLIGLTAISSALAEPREQKITIAAAADLKFAMDEIVAQFRAANPGATVEVVYGSSGKFHTQIRQGAPYDLYFSADIEYPRALQRDGLAASPVHPYAVGRIVLWSASLDAAGMSLADLADPAITRIAIANPRHAPYGKRAEEALRAAGLWQQLETKLVYGESVAHAAQFVQSGSAQVGIIALSLTFGAEMTGNGSYHLIDETLHAPLEQGFIITQRARHNTLASDFARHMDSAAARDTLSRYGFVVTPPAPPPAAGTRGLRWFETTGEKLFDEQRTRMLRAQLD